MQDYYTNIRTRLSNVENYNKIKDYSKNRYTLENYYEIGRLIIEAQGGEEKAKYGNKIIKAFSIKLKKDGIANISERTLRRIRQFYLLINCLYIIDSNNNIWSTLSTKLSWSHFQEIMTINDISEIEYYLDLSANNNLSVRELRMKIKNNEYKRLSNKARKQLTEPIQEYNPIDTYLKNPILLPSNNKTNINEKDLENLILENLSLFLNELGNGYSYITNQYKCVIDGHNNYIDILLFNIDFNAYVVIELKITELKQEHINQVEKYMNHIDKTIKKDNHNKTIGIIIVRKDNKLVAEYVSDKRVYKTTYKLV